MSACTLATTPSLPKLKFRLNYHEKRYVNCNALNDMTMTFYRPADCWSFYILWIVSNSWSSPPLVPFLLSSPTYFIVHMTSVSLSTNQKFNPQIASWHIMYPSVVFLVLLSKFGKHSNSNCATIGSIQY